VATLSGKPSYTTPWDTTKDARLLSLVLGRVRQHYARKSTAADRTDDALVRTIDLAMSKFSGNGVGEKRLATLALTSLRRNVVS